MKHLDSRYMLVGLSGRAGAGKDTAADVLCDAYQFYRFAFADPLRAEIVTAFGVDLAIFGNDQKERAIAALAIDRCSDVEFRAAAGKLGISFTAPRSPREIMRWWGTEYRRAKHPHYWTRKAAETLQEAFRAGFRRVVITDVRFRNEADFVRFYNGRLWEIKRATAECEPVSHQSEAQASELRPDMVIDNNRSMTAFAAAVMRAYRDTP